MRISGCGLAATISLTIDQILLLAPAIKPPIEPVVSITKTSSMRGLSGTRKVCFAGSSSAC